MTKQPLDALEMWGRKKQMVMFTIQGDVTAKQFEKIQRALLKIAERYNMGYAANDDLGYDVNDWIESFN